MTTLFTNPFVPVFSGTTVAPSATATFYLTQTSTLAPIFDDNGDPLPNPVTADAFGMFTNIYLDDSTVYRVVIKDHLGAVLDEVDPYAPNSGGGTGGDYTAGPGIFIDAGTRTISTVDAKDFREIWLNDFYPNATSTDTEAWLELAAFFNSGAFGNCRVMVAPSKGRGNTTTGNYFLDQDIVFTGAFALEIDGLGSVVRLTGSNGRLHYNPPPLGGANILPQPQFVVKNFVVQFAAPCDTFAYWDIPYQGSRINGTGYMENVRMAPQNVNDATHTANGLCRIRNTWFFTTTRCHYSGKPRTTSDLLLHPEQVGVVQDGVCVVTALLASEFNNVYQPVSVGVATLTGINGSFAPSGGGVFQRGNRVIQGGAVGYQGRSDGAYGWTWSLYDVQGTFTTGVAQVYDFTGTTLLGTLTISATGVFQQASEAISFDDGTTSLSAYGLQWTKPALVQDNLLNIVFGNSGWSPSVKLIEANGISCLAISDEVNCLSAIPNCPGLIDINNAFLVHIGGLTATNNGQGGATFIKLRNTIDFGIDGPKIASFFYPTDIDNTNKVGIVCNIAADFTSCGPMINTANRFNGVSTQGIRYFNNGHIGIGIDINDNTIHTWTPVVTAQTGTITSYTATGSYVFANGMLSFTISVQITNRGTATGQMYVTLPPIVIQGPSGITFPDSAVFASNTAQAFPLMATATAAAIAGTSVGIAVTHQNPANSAFSNYTGTLGNYGYLVSGTIPLRLN